MSSGLDPNAVPMRKTRGIRFVVIDDIPEPYRQRFEAALHGSGCPVVEGYDDCAYAQDWLDWCSGNWTWGGGPVGYGGDWVFSALTARSDLRIRSRHS